MEINEQRLLCTCLLPCHSYEFACGRVLMHTDPAFQKLCQEKQP